MMRCVENNHHKHDGYEEDMAPSSDMNDTDKDESKIPSCINFFINLHWRIYMDVSKSKCNIVTETLSQFDLSDVPINVIT